MRSWEFKVEHFVFSSFNSIVLYGTWLQLWLLIRIESICDLCIELIFPAQR